MRLLKQTQKNVLLSLIVLLTLSGCGSSQLVLYPIKGTDFCVKGDPECRMEEMDIGMSEFYFKKVLEAKLK